MSSKTLASEKYAYFYEPGADNIGRYHHVKHYTCASLKNGFLKEKFDAGCNYKLLLEDHNFTYEMRVTYAIGDANEEGLMVRSVGVYATSKTSASKNDGLFFETTPYFMEGQTGNGQLVFILSQNNGGELPEPFHKCLKIAAGFFNYLADWGIAPRDSTSLAKFKQVFGPANMLFIEHIRSYWIRIRAGGFPSTSYKECPDVLLKPPGEPTEAHEEMLKVLVEGLKEKAFPHLQSMVLDFPNERGKLSWNSEFWISIRADPDGIGTHYARTLLEIAKRLERSHTMCAKDEDPRYDRIHISFPVYGKTFRARFRVALEELDASSLYNSTLGSISGLSLG